MKPQLILILLFLGLFGSGITLFIPNTPEPPTVEPYELVIDTIDGEPLDFIGFEVVYPIDVYELFKRNGFTDSQAVFFAKQAMVETGDPNNQDTPLRPVNGRNNVFGLRKHNKLTNVSKWYDYDSKLEATLDYLFRIQESKYYAPDFDPAELVTKRPHCPDIPNYAAIVHHVKFNPNR